MVIVVGMATAEVMVTVAAMIAGATGLADVKR
jgi:multisubunit Na+/H+ antiporter MnhC subunit